MSSLKNFFSSSSISIKGSSSYDGPKIEDHITHEGGFKSKDQIEKEFKKIETAILVSETIPKQHKKKHVKEQDIKDLFLLSKKSKDFYPKIKIVTLAKKLAVTKPHVIF